MSTFTTGELKSFSSYKGSIDKYYAEGGAKRGLSMGWHSLDENLLLKKGMLTVITGIPSSGKSEWMDQVILQTIKIHGWHWTIFSPENYPPSNHFQKLAEKWTGKPMFSFYGVPCMSKSELDEAYECISGTTCLIDPPENDVTIDPILELVRQSKDEHNTDAFILDPWNELEHSRPKAMTETEYIGQALTKIRNFSRKNDIAMFIVAHPTKLQKKDDGNYPVPNPYDINGSANWRNKADVCISVWRDYVLNNGVVQIHVQKVRNKNLGTLGSVDLHWCRANGLFFETAEEAKDYASHGISKRIA